MVLLPCSKCCGAGCDICKQPYRVSGLPFSEYICPNGSLLVPGSEYPNLSITGDINQVFEVVNCEIKSSSRVLDLVDFGNSGIASATSLGYCKNESADPCRSAAATLRIKPFPAAVLPDGNTYDMGELVFRWNNGNPASASISGVGPDRLDETQANCYLILRSISIGGFSVEQPIGVTPLYDEIGTLWLYAENGQDSQLYISSCVPPANWLGPLTVTAELWSYGTFGLPQVYTLLDTKVFDINWPEIINVATDCPVEPCNVLPVSSCFYKDYTFECKPYTNAEEVADIESDGWVKEFNRNLGNNYPMLRCDTFYGQQVGCGECCGGYDPSLDDGIIGHTLFNRIEQNPVAVGDGFPGQITGSLVGGLTALRCVSSTPTEIVFEDSPPTKYACDEYKWQDCPPFGGPCVDVDGYACFYVSPYRPNDPHDGRPAFESCEECRNNCGPPLYNPNLENTCIGQKIGGFYAKILLAQKCRGSAVEIDFPDVRPFYDDGNPDVPYPWLLRVKISQAGVTIKTPDGTQPSFIPPVAVSASFAGVTVGDRPIETSLTGIAFKYCPLEAYGLVENPDTLTAYRFIPQDNFGGDLSITLTDYRANLDGSVKYTATIDIDGAYDSYCWLCGTDPFLQPWVPKPTNEPVYDAGNNATPVNVPLESNKTMTTKTGGPGTELANMLKAWGIHPKKSGGCKCKDMEVRMNRLGSACKDPKNLKMIVDHLQAEAKKRNLPFVRKVGEMLVLRAVKKFENNR